MAGLGEYHKKQTEQQMLDQMAKNLQKLKTKKTASQVFRSAVQRVVGEVQRPRAGMRLTGKADLSQVDDRRRKP